MKKKPANMSTPSLLGELVKVSTQLKLKELKLKWKKWRAKA